MGLLSYIKLGVVLIFASFFIFAIIQIKTLKSDLQVAQQNVVQLEQSVKAQKLLLEEKQLQYEQISKANEYIQTVNQKQREQIETLRNKFTTKPSGKSRDFGAISRNKPGLVNSIVNRATDRVNRCLEILSGSLLKPGETYEMCEITIGSTTP